MAFTFKPRNVPKEVKTWSLIGYVLDSFQVTGCFSFLTETHSLPSHPMGMAWWGQQLNSWTTDGTQWKRFGF